VTIRTFDAGGDKPVSGFTEDGEANPFPWCSRSAAVPGAARRFSVQLRALARAAVRGNLKVMFPMVTTPDELEAGRALFVEAVGRAAVEKALTPLPPLGIMVEVPAAALTIDRFKASFFSIGSNDLAQYVTACDRSNGALAALIDPLHPAVLDLIRARPSTAHGAGSASACAETWLAIRAAFRRYCRGLRELSVNPSALAHSQADDR
jgi:phosphotransferase system enzyme I (PtsI)